LTSADIVVFFDSDLVLFRPLSMDRFLRNGKALLHRAPLAPGMDQHIGWVGTARRILGIPGTGVPKHDYIGQMIPWRSDVLGRLQAHIERLHGTAWQFVIARGKAVAEYMLYGTFCDEVIGFEAAGHELWTNDLAHSIWTNADVSTPERFADGLTDTHVAAHIQSILPMSYRTRRSFIEHITGLAVVR
jgi:hypothetical protein